MTIDSYFLVRPPFPARVVKAVVKERWPFLITLTVLNSLAAISISQLPRIYESKSTLVIEYPRSTEQLTGLDTEVGVGRLETVGEKTSPISNQVALLTSSPIFQKALSRLNVPQEQISLTNLFVEPVPGTDLINVSYSSESPSLSAEVVQAVVAAYIEENRNSNREKGSSARQFLEQRLPQLSNKLRTAQEQLARFQEKNNFLGTTVETNAITNSLSLVKAQVTTLQAQLASTEQKINGIKAQLPSNLSVAINAAGLSQETGYQELQKQFLQAEAELANLQSLLNPQHPKVLKVLDKRNNLKALMSERSTSLLANQARDFQSPIDPLRQRLIEQWFALETERAAQTAQLRQLTQQLQELQDLSVQLPQLITQQARLQLSVDEAQKDYLAFKEKYTASRIAEQQNISNVRIVEPASMSANPIAPNYKLLFALFTVISSAIALGVVWLRRSRSNTIDGIIELREILPLPMLATVPWRGDGRLSLDESMDDPLLADSYRLLQAHIRMLPRNLQVIAVCSWLPSEGRSSVAANLALLEARSSNRVLLIDADGNLPGQPEFWGFHRSMLSAEASSATPSPAILHKVFPSFDVLMLRKEPQSTFLSQKWLAMLEQFRERYDRIILDCPPTVHGPDAAILASMADGVLWVVSPEHLGRREAEASAESLRNWSTRLLGQVLIGVGSSQPPALPMGTRSDIQQPMWALPDLPQGEKQ